MTVQNQKLQKIIYSKILRFTLSFCILIFASSITHAQTATTTDVLQSKIVERNLQIKQLEAEINQYNTEVINAEGQAKTLQSTLKALDLTNKKITKDITLTQTKISKTALIIQQLGNQIDDIKKHIETNKQAIISALRNTEALEDVGIVVTILSNKNVSDVWGDLDNINQIQNTIRDKSKELSILQKDMEGKQAILNGQKNDLLNLKQDLTGKKQAVQFTVQEKAVILVETQNKESTFKALVQTKEEQKAQFEKEVYDFESQLNLLIDKNSYPKPKNGVLSWPLDNIFVTQKFGKTVGAEKLYVSGSHNGVDFRASIGTRVKNILDGTIIGTGNTDSYYGCYSFGKWVMVKHDNGLSTIYAHLSVISVSTGQRLGTGDTVGYSGNTGYTTGPHLHIGLYATQGVRIEQFVNSRGCKQAIIPLADIKAYLDPLAYFPAV